MRMIHHSNPDLRRRKISNSLWFSNLVTSVILLCAIVVGVEAHEKDAVEHFPALPAVNDMILVVFTLEIVVKILGEGFYPLRFFQIRWNVFDFLIVVTSLALWEPLEHDDGTGDDGGGSDSSNTATMLRLLRLFRFANSCVCVCALRTRETVRIRVHASVYKARAYLRRINHCLQKYNCTHILVQTSNVYRT